MDLQFGCSIFGVLDTQKSIACYIWNLITIEINSYEVDYPCSLFLFLSSFCFDLFYRPYLPFSCLRKKEDLQLVHKEFFTCFCFLRKTNALLVCCLLSRLKMTLHFNNSIIVLRFQICAADQNCTAEWVLLRSLQGIQMRLLGEYRCSIICNNQSLAIQTFVRYFSILMLIYTKIIADCCFTCYEPSAQE